MLHSSYLPITKDTYVKIYIAEITGSDPKYGFARTFIDTEIYDLKDELQYLYILENKGIFEESIKIYKKKRDELISHKRRWFIFNGHSQYEIEREDVLDYLDKLNR
jgi:hypothetical protein